MSTAHVLLRTALAARTDLADAACIGQWALFDESEPYEDRDQLAPRHTAAVRLCDGCPCRRRCAELLDSLPVWTRDGGWAGQVVTPRAPRAARQAS